MKRSVLICIVLFTAVFLFSETGEVFSQKKKYHFKAGKKKSAKTGDRKILKDMMSKSPGVAVPAIKKAEKGRLKGKRNNKRARRIIVRIIASRNKHPQIKIAAAHAVANMKMKRAAPLLKRELRKKRINRNVKSAYMIALNRITGKGGFKGNPKYHGSPGYKGTPGYHGSPGYKGTPGYHGTPGHHGTP